MIKNTEYIVIFFLLFSFASSAQESIRAEPTGGCDSLEVTFALENAYDLTQYNSVEWILGDGTIVSNTLTLKHVYTSPGLYNVRCQLDGLRNIRLQDTIVVSETPVADFGFKDTIVTGSGYEYLFEPLYFTPVEGVGINYRWYFPDSSSINMKRPVFTFESEDIYTVKMVMTDENGCADSIVKKVPVSDGLIVPNVFSPNEDGINDYFVVTTPGDYVFDFRVFSRKGLQLYYSRSPKIMWDGRAPDGTFVEEGTYYYIIESNETPVKTSRNGFIQVFR